MQVITPLHPHNIFSIGLFSFSPTQKQYLAIVVLSYPYKICRVPSQIYYVHNRH